MGSAAFGGYGPLLPLPLAGTWGQHSASLSLTFLVCETGVRSKRADRG